MSGTVVDLDQVVSVEGAQPQSPRQPYLQLQTVPSQTLAARGGDGTLQDTPRKPLFQSLSLSSPTPTPPHPFSRPLLSHFQAVLIIVITFPGTLPRVKRKIVADNLRQP